MCLIVALVKVVPGYPIIVGANRDERHARAGEPPSLWAAPQKIYAGRDPVAGGTWLGVNMRGVLAALSNRMTSVPEDASRRSRGLLALDALGADSAASAIAIAEDRIDAQRYNPFNLLCADARRAVVLQHGDCADHTIDLRPGVHVLTTGDVNDENNPKVVRAHALVAKRQPAELEEAVELLQRICRDHGGGAPSEQTLCMHGEIAGTVSSSIVALDARGNMERYYHVQGQPCRGEYKLVFAMA